MGFQDEFAEFIRREEPLGPMTSLRVGGPAEFLVEPRTRDELAAVVSHCYAEGMPLHVLGGGVNLLVQDEGVRGAVLHLTGPEFATIRVEGRQIQAGCAAPMMALISDAVRNDLAGVENLIGIRGTVGGALRCNAGDGSASVGQFVQRVEVMDEQGQVHIRSRDEIRFGERESDLDDPVILTVHFELESDDGTAILKRMRKAWIQRKASEPFSFQNAVRAFKDPAGADAGELIERAGLARTRVGGAEISERNANYVVADENTCSRDVLRLLDLIQTQVLERNGVRLQREVIVW